MGQISIFEFLGQPPPIGSTVYFLTYEKIKKAVVISHDAFFAGWEFKGYIKVQEANGTISNVAEYYTSKEEAEKARY
ncbi:hypothetical protein [Clostridium sp. AM58-1XD]|uniref:hypothetical protein n=1 Tax=Clostridium sp. AM58-1XD TaxID=2292307 RepID=UPI000E490DB0|nr:hypothetical protein [Clostridium sp. AM58-1XD]RGZ00196.1 hypothetical protein DXA13_06235 [Clostridium sp. AM58-1XD]